MLRNYILVACRNLWKNKGFSAINIIGLAVGIAICLLILLFVKDELGYDRYNSKAAQIYRVDGDIKFGGIRMILAVSPDPMGPTMKKDYPQVAQFVRFRNFSGRFLVKKGNQNLQESGVRYADSTLFDVFSLPLVQGDSATALVEPNSIVLSETMARKYFSSVNVVGKTLLVNDTNIYKVTGVMKDMPFQSHFREDFFISMSSNPESRSGLWVMNNFNTYLVLRPGSDPKQLASRFDAMLDKYLFPQVQQMLGSSEDEFKKGGNFAQYTLTPLTGIHLNSNKIGELGANSDLKYVYIFSATAVFILFIACINFMNLSTARSSNRAKEVGIRKVLGSLRGNLVRQFLTESILLSFISLALALLIVSLCLPYFNALSGKDIQLHALSGPDTVLGLCALAGIVGLLAGSYPAFYLSSFVPMKVLKGVLSTGFKSGRFRSTLVIFQFSISIFLIISTIVIYNQLRFIRNKDIGFNREQVLVLQNTDVLGRNARAFRSGLMQIPGVQDVTMTGFLPTNTYRNEAPMFLDPTLDQKKAISLQIWDIDEHYTSTLGIKFVRGRNFSEQFPTDSTGIVINETAARLLGYADPLNKKLYIPKNFQAAKSDDNIASFHILGVVKDFNFNSLRQPVTPLALMLGTNHNSTAIRIHTTNIPRLITQVNEVWNSITVFQPFNNSFMDDDFNRIYNSEQRIGNMFINFAVLAIFIACLGLFGLVTYAAEQRSREIGIRKVLGASIRNIVALLSRDFLGLVIIASLITFPLAWLAMNHWLEDFAYRISIGWMVFAAAGVLAILIALATVSFQAVKAALANPVKSLKTE